MKKLYFYIPALFFALTLFANLPFPLLWNDEAECAMHSKSVLEYGYPKVHNGKNVLYPIRHTNKTLAIHKETDAYTGIGWAMFYYGTIGVQLASLTDDIYQKTLLLRIPFAFLGFLGLILYYITFRKLVYTEKQSFILSILFFTILTLHIDFALHLREMRYYSLVIFLTACSAYLLVYRLDFIYKISWLYVAAQTVVLWLVYNTFPPVFVVLIMFYFVVELLYWYNYKTTKQLLGYSLPLVLSTLFLIPVLIFFDTFHFSNQTAQFYNFNLKVYLIHFRDTLLYFVRFGVLEWIILLMGILAIFYKRKKIIIRQTEWTLLALVLFAVLYFLVINTIPHFVFTRYYLVLIVTQVLILSFQLIILYKHLKTQWFYVVVVIIFGGIIFKNFSKIEGRIYEMTHQYKGPLDFQIPYFLKKYNTTNDLIIATNYEECSYMYYLDAKVIMGFTLNNLENDLKEKPNSIVFRHDWAWNYEKEVFNSFFERNAYSKITFPVYDSPYNSIPEFNLPANNHLFKTKKPLNSEEKAHIYILK